MATVSVPPKASESAAPAILGGHCRKPKKVSNKDKIVCKLFCLSFQMQTLIPQLTGAQIRYSHGANMYPVSSYEGTHYEMRELPRYAEARSPSPYSEDRSSWLESTNWESGVSSTTWYQTEEQEEDETACLCSCSWKCTI